MDIQVVTIDPITRQATLAVRATLVTGISELVQAVILSLLDIPGRDVLDVTDGGGLPDLVGTNIDFSDPTELFGEVARKVKKTQAEIITYQTGLEELSTEARLREIQVVSIKPGDQEDTVLIKLRIINEAGRTADFVL